ncbi:MAG: hypothetical protein ACYDBQ_12005 [Thermoplasmatota archaeon]
MELTGILSGTGAKLKAAVGEDSVLFRGAYKGEVAFRDMVAQVRNTLLVLSFSGMEVELAAGSRAQALAARIRSPPSRAATMGIAPGMTVAVAGTVEEAFRSELRARAAVVSGVPTAPVDVVVFGVESAAALAALAKLRRLVAPGGVVWVIHPQALRPELERAAQAAQLSISNPIPFSTGTRAAALRP